MLSPPERVALGKRMAQHVLARLEETRRFDAVAVLSPSLPEWWQGVWDPDSGEGLNREIETWRDRRARAPVLIIHSDLPLVKALDVMQLLDAAEASGIALATDRAGVGSNALAIADGRDFTFSFGPGSRVLHAAQAAEMLVFQTPGLATDLDTPEDAAFVTALGFELF